MNPEDSELEGSPPPPPPPPPPYFPSEEFTSEAPPPPPHFSVRPSLNLNTLNENELAAIDQQQMARFEHKNMQRAVQEAWQSSRPGNRRQSSFDPQQATRSRGAGGRASSLSKPPGQQSILTLLQALVPLLSDPSSITEFRASLDLLHNFRARDEFSHLFDVLLAAKNAGAEKSQKQIISLTEQLREAQRLIGQASLKQRQMNSKIASLESQLAQQAIEGRSAPAAPQAPGHSKASSNNLSGNLAAGASDTLGHSPVVRKGPPLILGGALGVQSQPHPKDKEKDRLRHVDGVDSSGSCDFLQVFPTGAPRFPFGLESEFPQVHRWIFLQKNFLEI